MKQRDTWTEIHCL